MTALHAIILGVIQGLSEFIPISSSAHLILIPGLLHWPDSGLLFDVALHFGTLIALVVYFWKDWRDMLVNQFSADAEKPKLLWPIILACIPGAIFGAKLGEKVEESFRMHPSRIAVLMAVMGVVLFIADRAGKKERPIEKMTPKDWITVGLAQCLAILPGVSRSGITMTAGLFTGLKRDASARFSFLLSMPIILGSAIFEGRHLLHGLPPGEAHVTASALIIGIVTSGIVGYLVIGFLMNYLKKRSLDIFVAYRIIFAALVLLMLHHH
jgi:undecaprenyl-diphosphatase